MKKFLNGAIAGAALLGLSACASTWDIPGTAALPNSGDAFAKALQTRYLERATFEKGESDWGDVAYFVEKARLAASGQVPGPQDPAERGLGANADVAANRAKLVAALGTKAPKDAPDACALAQTWFDHWLEQLEEGHQADHIAEAKFNFDKALPQCVAKPVPAPVPVTAPSGPAEFRVFFDLGKASLTAEAKKTLAEVAKFATAHKAKAVYLAGHTDTSGNAKANEALAIKRTEAVAKELAKLGVATQVLDMKSFGETKLSVQTKDGVPEVRNRRVEIIVQK